MVTGVQQAAMLNIDETSWEEQAPKRPADTCKHCAITPLCRIYEISDPTCEDETINEEADNE